MKKISFIALTALAVFSISCSKDIETPSQDTVKNPKVLYATTDDDFTTKTSLDGKSVIWTSSDVISAFDDEGTNHQSTKTEVSNSGKDALFEVGSISVEDDVMMALYPYDENATFDTDDYSIETTIPTVQNIVVNSFANGANVAIAEGLTNKLKFRNVGAFLCLSIANDNIKSVKLSSSTTMTGNVVIDYNEGDPELIFDDSKVVHNYVELKGDFVKGQKYYFVVAPGEYEGLTITLTDKDGKTASLSNSAELKINRNQNLFIGALPEVPENKWIAKDPETPSPEKTTATWVASKQGYTNGTQYTSATVDSNISLAFGDGGNDGKYYDTGSGIRIYANGKVTVSAANGATISEIVLTYSDSGYTGTISANTGDYKLSSTTGTWTGSASSVVLTNTANTGHARIQKITVNYTGGADKTTTYSVNVDDKIIGGTVSADQATAKEGDEITLRAFPDTGYEFGSWNVTNASTSAAIEVADSKFIMPATDVNISATFNAIPARPENEIFYESFNTNEGTGGNDDLWSGNIASSDIKQDNDGWTYEKANGANTCAKFGAASSLGSATTPALGTACDATITFKAAAWNGNNENTTLKLSVIGGGIISTETVTLKKGEWDTFTATLTGLTASSKVKFEGNATSNSRFFLDEVSIVKTGEPTATYTVTVDNKISNGSISASPTTALEGVTVTLSATPKEGYEFDSWIVTGVTLADETSETTTFTMPAANVTVSASFKEIVIPDKTIAEFIAAGGIECYLTGTVGNIVNTTYGNFYLTDESGTIYIYGCKTPAGVEKQFNTLGVEFGDKIKVHASEYELYEENTDEATNVVFVEIIKKATKYDVTVANSIANGTVTVNPTQAAEGQTVAISATPNSNYKLKDGSVKVTKASGGEVTVSDNKFTMPAEAVTVSAEFEESIATTAIVNISKWLSDNPDVTVSAGSTVGSMVKSISIDSNITVTVAGNGNTGTFWGTSPNNDWRIYSKNGDEATVTITASNSKKIKSVKFAFSTSNGGGLKYNTTALTSGTAKSISPSGDSVTLSVPYSSSKTGQARITEIEIVYE